jgi:MYXO-CTERM domain-containing protein
MIFRSAAPFACVIVALVTTGTNRAHALSCASPELVAPVPDAVDVPTNTLVWCSKDPQSSASPIRVTDSEGGDVSGTQTVMSLPQYELLTYRPDAELASNSTYTVSCPIRYEGQSPSFVFTTGAGPRLEPPAVPSVSRVKIDVYPDFGWGPAYFAEFSEANEPQTIVVLDIPAGRGTLNPEARSGFVADAQHLSQTTDVGVGWGPCGGNWSDAKLGASTTVALGAFDVTGAFSGWSDTATVTIPGESCSLGSRASSPWSAAWPVMALAWFGARRRRSSERA